MWGLTWPDAAPPGKGRKEGFSLCSSPWSLLRVTLGPGSPCPSKGLWGGPRHLGLWCVSLIAWASANEDFGPRSKFP